jgi:hypothetical protein
MEWLFVLLVYTVCIIAAFKVVEILINIFN